MNSLQKPITSKFGSKSTASDVLKDLNLKGKNVVVTGGNSGIGLETVRALSVAGAQVITSGRDIKKSREALGGIRNVTALELNLSHPESIEAFSKETLKQMPQIDILINNAGMLSPQELTKNTLGFEITFAANHLGHFKLTNNLLNALKKRRGSRVVALSSVAHNLAPFDFEDWNYDHKPYDEQLCYGQSKVATSLFAIALDEREKSSGLRAYAVHPGAILSGLIRSTPDEALKPWGVVRENGELKGPEGVFKSTEQGAATSLWCATSADLEGIGGVYCADCNIAEVGASDSKSHIDVRQWAIDPAAAKKLWTLSEGLI